MVREENGKEKSYHVEYGFVRVRLPEADEELTMVVLKGFGLEPMMLLAIRVSIPAVQSNG